jgi:hypothetical protein
MLCFNADRHILFTIMLNAIMLSVAVVNVVILNVVMLSVVMLSVVAPKPLMGHCYNLCNVPIEIS